MVEIKFQTARFMKDSDFMKRIIFLLFFCFAVLITSGRSSLKSILYDFEGMNIGLQNIPWGAYSYGAVSLKIVSNPEGYSDMMGSRCAQVDVNWAVNWGAFGKGNSRYVEIDATVDKINFYFLNPLSNSANATIDLILQDDDDDNGQFNTNLDDRWVKRIAILRASSWQLISIPFNEFTDENAGGNGNFDAGFTGNGGKLLTVEWKFIKSAGETVATYFIDNICYSEGDLPTGNSIFSLPEKEEKDHCFLGAYAPSSTNGSLTPDIIEGLFPADPNKRIKYVNTFLAFSTNGTAQPNKMPGNSLQTLVNDGYIPIITWEPFYTHLPPLDLQQPKLQDIVNGNFDAYIDAVADKIKTFGGTVIVRPMHEFDGNWYPWCISVNGKNPQLFITAFRHFADRFNSRNVHNVQWMWTPNTAPVPNEKYNWCVNAFPGNDYVDLVGISNYNHPAPGTPEWVSFRSGAADSYYYLTKYFPEKPYIFCEVAARERYSSENPESQTKAEWVAQMDMDMQSFFRKARGLVFFHENKEHDWRINSSQPAFDSFYENIWLDNYYFEEGLTGESFPTEKDPDIIIYPNPVKDVLHIKFSKRGFYEINVLTFSGILFSREVTEGKKTIISLENLSAGIYFIEFKSEEGKVIKKIMKL